MLFKTSLDAMFQFRIVLLYVFAQLLAPIIIVETTNLQLKWLDPTENLNTEFRQGLADLLGKNIQILEHADITYNKKLLLCKLDSKKLFAAVTNSGEVKAIGDLVESLGLETEVDSVVKAKAEDYSRTVNAFTENWKPAKQFTQMYKFPDSHSDQQNVCFPENRKIIENNAGFSLQSFWFFEKNKMVGIYKAENETVALGLLWERDGERFLEFSIMRSIFDAYAAIPSRVYSIDESPFFYCGWVTPDTSNFDYYEKKSMTNQVHEAAVWIPKQVQISLYSLYKGADYLGTIFQIPGRYTPKSFIYVIWSVIDKQYTILHIGQIGTLKETEELGLNFTLKLQTLDFKNVRKGNHGSIAWFTPAGRPFEESNKMRLLKTVSDQYKIPLKYGAKTILSIEKFTFIAHNRKQLQQIWAYENICVIVKRIYKKKDYGFVRKYASVILRVAIFYGGKTEVVENRKQLKFYDSLTEAIDAAESVIIRQYESPTSLEWTELNEGKDYWAPGLKNVIIASDFLPSCFKAENISITEYWKSNSDSSMLLIVNYEKSNYDYVGNAAKAHEVNEEEYDITEIGFFGIAINCAGNVTWIGDNIPSNSEKNLWAHALARAKGVMEQYFNQILAFKEHWITINNNGILKKWNISDTQNILLRTDPSKADPHSRGNFWYEIAAGDNLHPVKNGGHRATFGEVLDDLAPNLPLFLNDLITSNPDDTTIPACKIAFVMAQNLGWCAAEELTTESILFSRKDPKKGIIVITKNKPGSIDPEHTFLFPILQNQNVYSIIEGNVTKLSGLLWQEFAVQAMKTPSTFGVSDDGWKKVENPSTAFTAEEESLILKAAQWNPEGPWKGMLVHLEKSDHISGDKFYILSKYGSTTLRFFIAWNGTAINTKDKLKYISGLGEKNEIEKAFNIFIMNPTFSKEMAFTKRIGWTSPFVVAVKDIFHIFVDIVQQSGANPEGWTISKGTTPDKWRLGIIPPRFENYKSNSGTTIYGFYGTVDKPESYVSAILQVQFCKGKPHLKSFEFGAVRVGAEDAKRDLYKLALGSNN